MLRSKFHRPWQPRISDGQLLNPSAHATESETSFSEVVEEAEDQVHVPEGSETAASASPSDAVGDVGPLASVNPDNLGGKSAWYANLMGRFARR
jgi:hypothetical protein